MLIRSYKDIAKEMTHRDLKEFWHINIIWYRITIAKYKTKSTETWILSQKETQKIDGAQMLFRPLTSFNSSDHKESLRSDKDKVTKVVEQIKG